MTVSSKDGAREHYPYLMGTFKNIGKDKDGFDMYELERTISHRIYRIYYVPPEPLLYGGKWAVS